MLGFVAGDDKRSTIIVLETRTDQRTVALECPGTPIAVLGHRNLGSQKRDERDQPD